MEQEKSQPIDLEVLRALYKKAYLPKTVDKISQKIKIFNKLEKKGLCGQWVVNKKRQCDKKDNFFKVALLNDLGKEFMQVFKALKHAKNKQKAQQ
ncbi:hypothetical protein [Helicobacter pylori]|uniref:hypothetical protein n=1 Tax=Helicobacter pylori TaxID=210 RepID=UPI000C30B692|nr:hypothetical protein [Helicobacter pylori]